MQSAVVYDVGYDNKMIKERKSVVTVRFLVAIKDKKKPLYNAIFKL